MTTTPTNHVNGSAHLHPFDVDWNEAWKEVQISRACADDPASWDKRAASFASKHGSHSEYVDYFMKNANIKEGETVFDMGCGTGSLAIPYAQQGNNVIAADFSKNMLSYLQETQKELQLENIKTLQMSWSDDWSEFGLAPECVDVAIASRSIATNDLKDSLLKLNEIARRRVCVTLCCSLSPRVDDDLLHAVGLRNNLGRDFIYAINILAQSGIRPEVSYIPGRRIDSFDSFEDAHEFYLEIIQNAVRGLVDPSELETVPQKLDIWLQDNLIENTSTQEDALALRLKNPRNVIWAFIAWDKKLMW